GLGQVYAHRIAGDRRENQEQAIAALTSALAYYTREGYPVEWAAIHLELGQVYASRLTGDQGANIEMALEEYARASEVYSRAAHPVEWARVQSQRGSAYLARRAGDRSENVEMAIAALLHALEGHTSESTPALWAQDQWNLGKAYTRRAHGDQKTNQTEALSHLRQALNTYYTSNDHPLEHRDMQLTIAGIHYGEVGAGSDQSAMQLSYRRAHDALAAARQIQQEIGWLVADVDSQAATEDLDQLFSRDAECLWRLGEVTQAIVALETGRILALLRQRDAVGALTAGVCEDHATMFHAARQQLREACARSDPALVHASREALAQTLANIRGHCDGGFLPTTPAYDDIARAAAPDQALIYLCAGDVGGMAFVVPPATQDRRDPIAVALPHLTRVAVDGWLWRKDAEGHVIGGYLTATQMGGAALLEMWIGMDGDAEREHRLTLPLGDAAAQLSPAWSTLRYTLGGVVATWRTHLASQMNLPLREALRDDSFISALNWFFLEGEVERILHDLHEA
ncbi:MAG TPA: hypothetical protein VKB76_19490, partial [Ktedonobacterales bacterium]|nr:hypothetical protein [Ktedonobacterales bacterium]